MPVQPKQYRSSNARFTGTASIPAILALGTSSVTFAVTPAAANDSLAVGEPIDAYSVGADLPSGVILGQARVTAANTVKLTFLAVLAVGLTSINWTIIANRS